MRDTDTNTNQNLSGSKTNIHILEVRQMCRSECIPISRHRFDIENEALMLHGETNLVKSHDVELKILQQELSNSASELSEKAWRKK